MNEPIKNTIPFLNYSPEICERCTEFAKADQISQCNRGKDHKYKNCFTPKEKKK